MQDVKAFIPRARAKDTEESIAQQSKLRLSVYGIDPGPLEDAARRGIAKSISAIVRIVPSGSDSVDEGYEHRLALHIITSTSKIYVHKTVKYHT